METNKEIKELERRLSNEYEPIKNPVVQLIEFIKSKNKRKKLKEIEDLKLEIEKAKLTKELKEI